MKFLQVCLAAFLFFQSLVAIAQPVFKTGNIKATGINPYGFTLAWESDAEASYQLVLEPVNRNLPIQVISGLANVGSTDNKVIFSTGEPATVYHATIKLFEEGSRDTSFYKKYYSTASRSGGSIRAMFNHPVDNSYKDIEDAVDVNGYMRDSLIAFIDRIENTLDIAIYNSFGNSPNTLIAGAINAAHNRGVQVRVIHCGSTSSSMITHLNQNIPRLASPEPNFPVVGLMHHKFVIADADHEDPTRAFVWTGSTNWTTGQINGPDRNNVILVQDQALAQTYKIEFEEMWGGSSQLPNPVNARFGQSKLDNTPKEFLVGNIPVECYFSPSDGTEQVIRDLINGAQYNITIATMLITRPQISMDIVNAFNNGINTMSVLLDTQNPTGSQKLWLMQNLPTQTVREFNGTGQMHHKMMIVDHGHESVVLLNGSHNWSAAAEQRNDENTLLVFDQNIANQYYQAIGWMLGISGGSLDVNELEMPQVITLFPNPATQFFYLNAPQMKPGILTVVSSTGKVMESKVLGKEAFNTAIYFDTSGYTSGLYLVRLENADGVFSRKLIIR
ncbi:MAG: phospholipase D-like domain-containing protein [Luteibaculaceae bacterium]